MNRIMHTDNHLSVLKLIYLIGKMKILADKFMILEENADGPYQGQGVLSPPMTDIPFQSWSVKLISQSTHRPMLLRRPWWV